MIGERYPHLLDDMLAASLMATASLPLHAASGSPLGAAGFGWDRPQEFSADQVSRLDLIARLAAQVLDHVQLLERNAPQESTSSPATTRLVVEDDRLTRREIEVLRLLAIGYRNAEIAGLLGVSLRTVESERSQLRKRLGLRTHAQLVQFAIDQGFAHLSRTD